MSIILFTILVLDYIWIRPVYEQKLSQNNKRFFSVKLCFVLFWPINILVLVNISFLLQKKVTLLFCILYCAWKALNGMVKKPYHILKKLLLTVMLENNLNWSPPRFWEYISWSYRSRATIIVQRGEKVCLWISLEATSGLIW